MKELNKIVTEKVATMIEDGSIETMIQDRLVKTIESCIEDSMKDYSDFGRSLKEKIKESIGACQNDITIPVYNNFIKDIVMQKFVGILEENCVKHLADIVEASIPKIDKTAKFSDIMDTISEGWGSEAREAGEDCIEIESELSGDGTALYVTIREPQYDNKTKVTFYKHGDAAGWTIGYISERGYTVTGRATNAAKTYMSEVSSKLFQYYAMHTEFEDDVEFEDIDVSGY